MVAVFALLGMSGDALAQGTANSNTSIMSLAASKGVNTFRAVRTIIFIVGGFGLVGVAFGAIFGKINWKWFAGLAVGLAILLVRVPVMLLAAELQQLALTAENSIIKIRRAYRLSGLLSNLVLLNLNQLKLVEI